MTNKSRIVFFGTPNFSAVILQALIDHHLTPAAIVTVPDQSPESSTITQIASKHSIPVLKPTKLKDPAFVASLSAVGCTLIVVAAYGKIIPQTILDIPKYGSLNVHPSLLPKYRGATPMQAAILAGERQTGVTIILMDQEMDHGDIIAQTGAPIALDETYQSLSEKMAKAGADLLIQTIPKHILSLTPQPQDHSQATYTKPLTREDGFIDLNNPPDPAHFERMVRAYYPWPGVYTRLRQGLDGQAKLIKFLPMKMIQLEGKQPMSVKAFLNGYPQYKPQFSRLYPTVL